MIYDSRSIIERMKQVEKVTGDKELAERIGVEAGTLSKWKNRNSLPVERLVAFATEKNISVDWLVFGTEKSQLDTAQQMALLAFNALNDQQKLQAIAFMSGLQNENRTHAHNQFNQNNIGVVAEQIHQPIKQTFK